LHNILSNYFIKGEDLELQRLRERVENLKNRAEDNRKILNKLNEKIVNVISEPKENGLVAGEEMDQEKQQQVYLIFYLN
jgi:hypothetical protein